MHDIKLYTRTKCQLQKISDWCILLNVYYWVETTFYLKKFEIKKLLDHNKFNNMNGVFYHNSGPQYKPKGDQ